MIFLWPSRRKQLVQVRHRPVVLVLPNREASIERVWQFSVHWVFGGHIDGVLLKQKRPHLYLFIECLLSHRLPPQVLQQAPQITTIIASLQDESPAWWVIRSPVTDIGSISWLTGLHGAEVSFIWHQPRNCWWLFKFIVGLLDQYHVLRWPTLISTSRPINFDPVSIHAHSLPVKDEYNACAHTLQEHKLTQRFVLDLLLRAIVGH